MKKMMVFHMGGNKRFLRIMESDLLEPSMQQLINMRKQYDLHNNSPQLSEEKLQQLMQVVENIRCNRDKDSL